MAKTIDLRKIIFNVFGNNGKQSTIGQSATSVTLVAENKIRKEVYIRNDTNKNLYISFSATAILNKGIQITPRATLIEDKYTGIITGIWPLVGSGNAEIIEVTT